MDKQISEEMFRRRTAEAVKRIHPAILSEFSDTDPVCAENYRYVERYALENRLHNTAVALPLVHHALRRAAQLPDSRFGSAETHLAYLRHALRVTRILIDLRAPLRPEEEDRMLAAALCHVLPENIRIRDLEQALTRQCQLDPEVCKLVSLIFWESNEAGAGELSFYNRIQEHKLALLITLADRSNLLEQLSGLSRQTARKYMDETRQFFFRMSFYARENHYDLISPVEVLMDKIRCLLDVSEILLSRYEKRETELIQEILDIREENSNIRRSIQILREEDLAGQA